MKIAKLKMEATRSEICIKCGGWKKNIHTTLTFAANDV